MLTLVLLALAACSSAFGDELCPNRNLDPCACLVQNNIPTIYCNHLQGLKGFQEILPYFKGIKFSVTFMNCELGDIPSDLFSGYTLHKIWFYESQIDSLGEKPLSGLEDSLYDLAITDSIDEKKWKSGIIPISHLKKLELFTFDLNHFTEFSNEWFAQGPLTLRQLTVSLNGIKELGDKVFAPLTNIEQIWISDNPIKQLSRSMFPNPAPKLRVLQMGSMELKSLPEDLFQGMPALRVINLDENKLLTMPQKTWQPVWNQLIDVSISKNREFVCDKNIRWIYEGELPKEFFGQCYGSNILAGKLLSKLTLSDIDSVE